MKRVLFAYPYCSLGGVATVIKQRLPGLIEHSWQVDGLFKVDNGGVNDLEAAGMARVSISGSAHDSRIVEAAKSGQYDRIVIIDDPGALRLALPFSTNLIYEIHTPKEDVLLRNDGEILARCPLIIVPSEWSKNWVLGHFPQVRLEQITVAPNIVDADRITGNSTPYPQFECCELLWVGKVASYKNWREALRVASIAIQSGRVRRLTFVTGGHVDQQATLDVLTEVANLGITAKFRWFHNLPYGVMISCYRNAAQQRGVLLSTSLAESFCYVVHEAMRANLPVVSSRVGAVTEVVSHLETGALYDAGDYHEAARFVMALLESDDLRNRCTDAAKQRLEERYSVVALRASYLEAIADHRFKGSSLRIAAIMDEFTYNSFAPECHLMQLTPEGWVQELEYFRPEVLFLESAWRGKDEKWGSKVGHLSPEVLGIIDWCREQGTPTVFWNKEDPIHFETFLTTASRVDLVFTTDIDCVGRYKMALGHDRVYFLPFAAQPKIHNPIELYQRKDAFCFAGAYYARYPDRTTDLETFIKDLPNFRPVEIYDRNFGKDHAAYMFPEAFRKFIVGTLPPDQIDRAYKGYRFGINLNSIKSSQTMFARRVYELLASNTVTISNYSRGVRNLFGDLVISSDNAQKILHGLQSIDLDRLRLAGLRKVMLEHTYGARIAHIAQRLGIGNEGDHLPPVCVVAYVDSEANLGSIMAQFDRQAGVETSMILILASDIDALAGKVGSETILALPEGRANALRLRDVVSEESWIAPMFAEDYYGENYLLDLVLATRYSSAAVIGKVAYHALEGGTPVIRNAASAYRPAERLAARRALVNRDLVADSPLVDWTRAVSETEIVPGVAGGLAVDPFNYCEQGSQTNGRPKPEVAPMVDDLPGLDVGFTLKELILCADSTGALEPVAVDAPVIEGCWLLEGVPKTRDGEVVWEPDGKHLRVRSTLRQGKHSYLFQPKDHPVEDVAPDGSLALFLETSPGLNLQWAALLLDAEKQRIGHVIALANRNARAEMPVGTTWVRFGLRVYGSGEASVERLVLGERQPASIPVVSKARSLVLTNHYPCYDDIYRNGFVHSRVKAYHSRGELVDVFRLRPDHALSFHEFENAECMTGSPEQLNLMLGQGVYESVCVHFLDEAMWAVLQPHLAIGLRVVVWLHGAEVQPWWRRKFNYDTEEELESEKKASDRRLAFWRGALTDPPANLHLVFVSQYFADEVMEDLGVKLPADSCSIIHNPIDTDLFRYTPKDPMQRLKILSIRPFASAKYANDLSVAAILTLRDRPFFDDLEFRIIGEGKLFDVLLAPLRGLANVTVERRFLSHVEIAELHRDYGVFLNPTRMDAQGVSRDEAMASGLVPITNDVAAIPEFVDEKCGFMAPPEDSAGLAAAIETLYYDPARFLAMSEAAAERVRLQSSADVVIRMELNLFSTASSD